MRSLGSTGVPLYGVDEDPNAPGFLSRYCRGKFVIHFNESRQQEFLDAIIRLGKRLKPRPILVPTSDELSLFVAKYANPLEELFIFPKNDPILVRDLISKEGMYNLARRHAVPTPHTIFPKNLEDVLAYSEDVKFPIMLKGIHGNRLQLKTGKKMVIAHSKDELIENYKKLEDPGLPNLMIQEYIPGRDDQIYIFNGYFNEQSDCLAAFTGYKIRQFPIHVGCASLGEVRWNKEVAELTIQFMKLLGYRGILDIGYRLDARDGRYKVLDINPRVGQAFRLFVGENNMDVIKSLYLDLTRQKIPPIAPREGRRWVIEDFDIISSWHYYQEGTLKIGRWFRSFKGLEEAAWFNWRDPLPFFMMVTQFIKRILSWMLKNFVFKKVSAVGRLEI